MEEGERKMGQWRTREEPKKEGWLGEEGEVGKMKSVGKERRGMWKTMRGKMKKRPRRGPWRTRMKEKRRNGRG